MLKKISGGFFISNALQAGLQFLLIPFVIRGIGVEEYGKWGLFEPAIYLFALLAQIGGNWSILKLVNVDKLPLKLSLQLCFKMCLLPTCIATVLACIWVMLQFKSQSAIFLMPIIIISEAALGLGLAAARAKLLALPYFIGISSKFGILALFAFLNIAGHSLIVSTAIQWLAVYAIAVSFSAILVNYQLFKSPDMAINVSVQEQELKLGALKYGVPLMISAVFSAVLNNADRYIVSSILDHKTLGSYIVALKLASILNFIITPIALWWPTARFQHIEDADRGQAFFSRMSLQFSFGYSFAGVLLYLAAPWVLPVLAPRVQIEFAVLLPLILGVVIRAIEPCLNIGLLQVGKTHLLIYTTAIGAMVQIVLGYILAHYFSVIGIAWAFVASNLITVILITIISQRIYKINFSYIYIVIFIALPFSLLWKFMT